MGFPSNNIGADCRFLFQGIVQTQGLNPCFLNCRQTLDHLNYQESIYIYLIYHASKVMLKILQARLQQYMNCELPDVQPGFRKGRGTRDQITNIIGSLKKQESSRKTLPPLYWLCQSLWLCGSQQTGKFQTTWHASWEICMQVKKQQLELDMEQQAGSKSEKD